MCSSGSPSAACRTRGLAKLKQGSGRWHCCSGRDLKMEDLVLKTLDAGPMYLYVLELPVEEEGVAGFKKAATVPVLRRKHGILVAVPLGSLL